MRSAVVVVVLIAGCDQVYGLTGREDAGPDAPCALGNFDPSRVFALNGFPRGTFDPTISGDGLELHYVVQLLDPITTLDLRYATRASLESPWTTGLEIDGLNSDTAEDVDPTLTEDGRSLLFVTSRNPSIHPRVVYELTRTARGAEWSTPALRAGINVNAHSIDISADGKTLYVMDSDDDNGTLYRFERTGIGMDFGPRTMVGKGMQFPTVSHDQSEMFFHDGEGIKHSFVDGNGMFTETMLVVPDRESADLSHDGKRLMYQTADGVEYIERGCKDDQ